jgi:hypothetical protein
MQPSTSHSCYRLINPVFPDLVHSVRSILYPLHLQDNTVSTTHKNGLSTTSYFAVTREVALSGLFLNPVKGILSVSSLVLVAEKM